MPQPGALDSDWVEGALTSEGWEGGVARAQQVDAVIGRNIRAFRAYQGLSQEDLGGKMAGAHPTWTRQTVSDVERGRRGVLVSEALSLAEVFGVPFERLIRGVM